MCYMQLQLAITRAIFLPFVPSLSDFSLKQKKPAIKEAEMKIRASVIAGWTSASLYVFINVSVRQLASQRLTVVIYQKFLGQQRKNFKPSPILYHLFNAGLLPHGTSIVNSRPVKVKFGRLRPFMYLAAVCESEVIRIGSAMVASQLT